MHRGNAEGIVFAELQSAEIGLAMRTAFSSMVLNTGSSSPGEPLMTWSTSAVAVCCCRQIFAQLVEQPGVLDGDDRLGGEVRDQLDLLVGEWPHLLAVDSDAPTSSSVLEHRHDELRARAAEIRFVRLSRVANIQLYELLVSISQHIDVLSPP